MHEFFLQLIHILIHQKLLFGAASRLYNMKVTKFQLYYKRKSICIKIKELQSDFLELIFGVLLHLSDYERVTVG